jgi:hypothetical protein
MTDWESLKFKKRDVLLRIEDIVRDIPTLSRELRHKSKSNTWPDGSAFTDILAALHADNEK